MSLSRIVHDFEKDDYSTMILLVPCLLAVMLVPHCYGGLASNITQNYERKFFLKKKGKFLFIKMFVIERNLRLSFAFAHRGTTEI